MTPTPPVLEHYVVQDSTVPALICCLDDSPRGCISHQDELKSLFAGLNQFTNGKGNEKQFYLTVYDCGTLKIDRKGQPPIYITNPFLAIIGGIQPEVLVEMFKQESMDDGTAPRYLFMRSENHSQHFTTDEISDETKKEWSNFIEYLYSIPLQTGIDKEVPFKTLKLEAEAVNTFKKFNDDYCDKQVFLSKNASLIIPKLIGYCLKFCGLLHILKQYELRTLPKNIDEVITRKTTEEAIRLTDFFLSEAVEILQLYKKESRLSKFEKVLLETIASLKEEVRNCEIPLSSIVAAFNEQLPKELEFTSEKISKMLNSESLKMKTHKGAHNRSHLIWDQERIDLLLSENGVTTVTTVTEGVES